MNTLNSENLADMMMRLIRFILWVTVLVVIQKPVYAQDNLIVVKKSIQDYSSAMSSVRMGLEENGFKLQFVQRVDVGLAKAGYHLDKYRIVFFMPKKGMTNLLSKNTYLADMFPLKVTVYQDKGKVYIFAAKNSYLLDASTPKNIRARFKRWDKRIDGMITTMF